MMAKITKEDAIFCEKSYIGETNCIDCKYYATDACISRESHRMAVKALEQELILDKIKEEVELKRKMYLGMNDIDWLNGCDYVLSVIDKYKESNG